MLIMVLWISQESVMNPNYIKWLRVFRALRWDPRLRVVTTARPNSYIHGFINVF